MRKTVSKQAAAAMAPLEDAGDTRLTILRTARELIQTRSYLGLSFQDLADRVGIRKASLYHHFPSKEALGIAVLDRSREQFDDWVAQLAQQGQTPASLLSAYIAMFRNVLGAGRRVCPAGAMGPGWDSIEPGLQQAVQRMRQRQIDWLTMVIGQLKTKAGKTGGATSTAATPAPTPTQMAAQVFAQCQGGLLSARISGRAGDFDDALAPLMHQLQLPPLP